MNLTPTSLLSGLAALVLVAALSLMYGAVYGGSRRRLFSATSFAVLFLALVVSQTEWVLLQLTALVGERVFTPRLGFGETLPQPTKHLCIFALGLHVMVSWGPWATVASLALLTALPYVVEVLAPQRVTASHRGSIGPSTRSLSPFYRGWCGFLWWTLMGQVNGLQFCYEGVCPHPRELDPGAVRVQGGYYGEQEQLHPRGGWR